MQVDYELFQIVRLIFGHEDNAFDNDFHSGRYERRKKRPCLILDLDNENDRFLIVPGSRKENEDAIFVEKDENNGLEDTTGFLIEVAEWNDVRGEIIGNINHADIQKFEELDIKKIGENFPYYEQPGWTRRNIGVHDIVLVEGEKAIVARSRNSSLDLVYLSEQLSANDRVILTPNKRNNLDSKMSIPWSFHQNKKPEIKVKLIGKLNRKNQRIFDQEMSKFPT